MRAVPLSATINDMSSYRHTIEHAIKRGYKVRHIDDDCFLIEDDDVKLQVVFDNYSPSNRFLSAELIGTTKTFGSYRTVRSFLNERLLETTS